VGTTGII